ncbi:hypothetical protein K2X33_02560 [bacterium]|nr:hypothetical protein [bacterium]
MAKADKPNQRREGFENPQDTKIVRPQTDVPADGKEFQKRSIPTVEVSPLNREREKRGS